MSKQNLELLNSFRAAEGLAPFADWRKARHQPMLDTYMAAAEAEAMTSHASNLESVVAAVDAFDNDQIVTAVKEEEIPSYKEFARYDKSAVDKPVGFIHQFLAHHGDKLTRKEAVHALVSGYGVNYSTARTQYQRWYAANKAK